MMENSVFCAATVGIYLLLFPALRGVSGQDDDLNTMWDSLVNKILGQELCETVTLYQGCSITPDCSTISCTVTFASKQAKIKFTINKCRKPISVTANVRLPKAEIDWWYTFDANNTVMVPDYTYKTKKGAAGVYLKLFMTPDKGYIRLKIALLARITVLGITATPGYVGLVNKKLPIATRGCDFLNWWHVRDTPAQIGILVAMSIVALGILTGFFFCCCCCCCCRPCRKSKDKSYA